MVYARKTKRRGATPLVDGEKQRRRDVVFGMVVEAALKGERCPTGDELDAVVAGARAAFVELVAAGRLRSEVYARNYRVVEVRDGEHTGKRTKEAPPGWACFLVNGRFVET